MDNNNQNQNQKHEKNVWAYVAKGIAVAVVGGGVCAVAIILKEPGALWGLLLIALIVSYMD